MSAYTTWVAAGEPWTLAAPIRVLVDQAEASGVAVLGTIGNRAHLTATRPQDHTPFPLRPWPVPLPGYWVCAGDLADGPWSDVMLAGCRAGRYPWVKYLNFRGHHYDVRNGWAQTPSTDQHLHVSARSDHLHTTDVLNPFGDAMWTADQVDFVTWQLAALVEASDTYRGGPDVGKPVAANVRVRKLGEAVAGLSAEVARLHARLDAMPGGGELVTEAAYAAAEAGARAGIGGLVLRADTTQPDEG